MIRTIAAKEIRENLNSFKFTIIFILLAALISVSLFVMYSDYQIRLENYQILKPDSSEPVAIVAPTPLSIFAKGLDGNIGRSFRVVFGGQLQVGGNQHSANALFRLFTVPDMLFIVKVILALCALLFSFDMISGEKETKTLSLALANSVRRSTFLIGKWLGGFLTLIVPFILLTLAGIIIISLSPSVQFSGGDWMKLGLIIFSSIVYTAIFISLGMFVSCITRRSSSSMVVSLFLWAVIVFVIPNLGNTLARQFIDIPSVRQIEMKRDQVWIKEIFLFIRTMKAGDNSATQDEVMQNINNENTMIMADYRARFNGLVALSKNITRLSPAATFTHLATDFAGTGIREETRVKEAVLRYKDNVWDKPTDSGGNILGEFPAFTFSRSTVGEVISTEGMLNITILVLLNMLIFVMAFVAFLQYDIR
ncbi:hypothetical protein ES708_20124 [subsurface metagenome]